jgi:alpha-mannosidase
MDGQVLLRAVSILTAKVMFFFSFFQIVEVTELSLSANQERTDMEKKRLVWKVEGSTREEPKVVRGGPVDPAKLVVELAPMEIRTFHVDFDHLQMFGS